MGMARDLYENFDSVRGLFDAGSEIFGYDLADVCFYGPEEKLKQTVYTQPAVFIHSVAVNMILKENGVFPEAAAGHSLGEYSALVCAGALSLKSAAGAIALRSSEMQRDCEENPGTMAAVIGMEFQAVERILEAISANVVAANYNSPGQVVIAGEISAVERACSALKEAGAGRAMTIPVGGAYHSPLMKRSAAIVSNHIEKELEFDDFAFPVYSNVSSKATGNPGEFRRLLSSQISSPVLWYPILKNMYNDGIRRFIEVGPGKVLQGLARKSLNNDHVEIGGIDTFDQLEVFLREEVLSP